jgi:hypothetical protein
MRRRNFIAGLASTTAAWPAAAHAQQPERVRRIGVLMPTTDDLEARTRLTTFQQALQGLGWTDGRNVHIETRFAAGKCRRFAQIRSGVSCACARRHPGYWRLGFTSGAAGDPDCADCIRNRPRSCGFGLRP